MSDDTSPTPTPGRVIVVESDDTSPIPGSGSDPLVEESAGIPLVEFSEAVSAIIQADSGFDDVTFVRPEETEGEDENEDDVNDDGNERDEKAYTIADEDGDAVKQIIEEEIIELEMLHEGNIVTIDETDMTEQDYLTSVKEDSPEHVVADSLDEMNEILHDYFDRTSTRFAVTVSKGIKNSVDEIDFSEHKIYWQDIHSGSEHSALKYDGVPYVNIGRIIYQCQFGEDLKKKKKKLINTEGDEMEDEEEQKPGGRRVKSKKCGCPAQLVVRKIIKFPGHKLEKNTDYMKKFTAKRLKDQLKANAKTIKMRLVYLGILPALSDHKYHENVTSSIEPVDKRVSLKIQDLVLRNVSISDIPKEVDIFVQEELFYQQNPPEKSRRRYYPNRRVLINIAKGIHEYAYLKLSHLQALDELMNSVMREEPETLFHFRINDMTLNEYFGIAVVDKEKQDKLKRKRLEDIQGFIYFHQSHIQRSLLTKYGTTVYITQIKISERSSKALAVSMYLLAVRTNVDYQVVGTILMNKYNDKPLREILSLYKEANEGWVPKYFMIDMSEDLLFSVTELFPDTEYYFNSSSCFEVWRLYLSQSNNGLVGHCDEILTYLNSMRISTSKDELTNAASALEQSQIWQQSELLRTWFQTEWLPIAEKWVREYRPFYVEEDWLEKLVRRYETTLIISTTRGSDTGTIGLIQKLTTTMPDESYKSYVSENKDLYNNAKTVLRRNLSLETDFGLTLFMVPNAEIAFEKLSSFTSTCDVLQTSFGNFTVTMETDEPDTLESYMVYFGNELNYPSCTCDDWKINSLPCQHMFAVFLKYDQFNYSSLSPIYRASPIFDLDYCCLRRVEVESVSKTVSTQTGGPIFKKLFPFETSSLNKIKKLRNALKSTSTLFADRSTHERMTSELASLEKNFSKRMQAATAKKASPQIICKSVGAGLGKVIPASSITIPGRTQQQQRQQRTSRREQSANCGNLVNSSQNRIGFVQIVHNSSPDSPQSSLSPTETTTTNRSQAAYKIILQSDKLSKISPHDIVDQLKQSIKLRCNSSTPLQKPERDSMVSVDGKENDENVGDENSEDISMSDDDSPTGNDFDTNLPVVEPLLLEPAAVTDDVQAVVTIGQKRKFDDGDTESSMKKINLNED